MISETLSVRSSTSKPCITFCINSGDLFQSRKNFPLKTFFLAAPHRVNRKKSSLRFVCDSLIFLPLSFSFAEQALHIKSCTMFIFEEKTLKCTNLLQLLTWIVLLWLSLDKKKEVHSLCKWTLALDMNCPLLIVV